MATVKFTRRPELKNLKNRSLSFQEEDISLVKPLDIVDIEVQTPSSTIINIQLTGSVFLKKLVRMSKGGNKFLVLKY
jgi:hypothetical protein